MAESAESMTTYVMDSAKDAEEALSPERVKTLFRYDPKTGFVTALTGSANGRWKPGRRVGSELTCGYRVVFIGGRLFYEHRVIWVLVTGRWPNDHIDHINRVRNDNRWENLRAATRRDNQRNQPVRRDNRSGYRGVCQVSPSGWRVRGNSMSLTFQPTHWMPLPEAPQ